MLTSAEAVENVPTQHKEITLIAAMEGNDDDDDKDGKKEGR